jgi:hypothetical protein
MLLTRLLPPVLLAAAATACAQQGASRASAAASCELPVIVAFASPPTDAVLADLGRASGARLEDAASLTTNIYSLTLRADGEEAVCRDAVERLRGDARVRSVDLDERRQIRAR